MINQGKLDELRKSLPMRSVGVFGAASAVMAMLDDPDITIKQLRESAAARQCRVALKQFEIWAEACDGAGVLTPEDRQQLQRRVAMIETGGKP